MVNHSLVLVGVVIIASKINKDLIGVRLENVSDNLVPLALWRGDELCGH